MYALAVGVVIALILVTLCWVITAVTINRNTDDLAAAIKMNRDALEAKIAERTIPNQSETWEMNGGTFALVDTFRPFSSEVVTLVSKDNAADRQFTLLSDGTIRFNKAGIYHIGALVRFVSGNTFTIVMGGEYAQGFVNFFNGSLQQTVTVKAGSTLRPGILSNNETEIRPKTRLTITSIQPLSDDAVDSTEPLDVLNGPFQLHAPLPSQQQQLQKQQLQPQAVAPVPDVVPINADPL